MTRFRLATRAQMVVMTIVWLGVLVAIDYAKNPRARVGGIAAARADSVGLSLWINHLCCPGCFGEARDALAAVPWVDRGQIRAREPVTSSPQAAPGPAADDGGWVDIGLTELKDLDFVEIDHVLREHGMVVSRFEFGGPRHFRLQAKVRCCGMCEEAVARILSVDRARSMPRLRWVDSVSFDRAGQHVTVHARYQEPGNVVDIADLLGAFDEVGLPAFSLHVLAEKEGASPEPAGGEETPDHDHAHPDGAGHTH
jgi:hypothetical protein